MPQPPPRVQEGREGSRQAGRAGRGRRHVGRTEGVGGELWSGRAGRPHYASGGLKVLVFHAKSNVEEKKRLST